MRDKDRRERGNRRKRERGKERARERGRRRAKKTKKSEGEKKAATQLLCFKQIEQNSDCDDFLRTFFKTMTINKPATYVLNYTK